MARSFDLPTLISLPKADARRMSTMCLQLISQARAVERDQGPLPLAITRPLVRLEAAYDTLYAVLSALAAPPPPDTRGADQALDACWRSLHHILDAYRTMPGASPAQRAQRADIEALMAQIFPDGLRFLNEDYLTEYTLSSAKISILTTEANLALLHHLGLEELLGTLKETQADYGAALGITQVVPPPPPAAIADALLALRTATRDYLLKVAAWNEPEVPGSAELSQTLLYPATQWT